MQSDAAVRPRDRMFRYGLKPRGPLADLAEGILAEFLLVEQATRARRRRRRPADLEALRHAIAAIVANLAYHVLFPPRGGGRITMPLSRLPDARGRVAAGFSHTLRPTLEMLDGIGVLHFAGAAEQGLASTIAPSDVFAGEVVDRGATGADFDRAREYDTTFARKDRSGKKTLLPWPSTDESATIEGEMAVINRRLEDVVLHVVGDVPVDHEDRRLVRHFTSPWFVDEPTLACGGRLFGGFWQTLRRTDRRHIRIGGEPVVEVDFRQAFPRLAYAQQGVPAPSGDLYSLPGLEGLHGAHRAAVKQAVGCLLFCHGKLRRWPEEVAEGLPEGWTVPRFRKAFLKAHKPLRPILGTGIGHQLMRTESDILMRVLLRCAEAGVVVLPLHDAVICARSSSSFVSHVMEEESLSVCGQVLPVSVDERGPSCPAQRPLPTPSPPPPSTLWLPHKRGGLPTSKKGTP